MRSTAIAVAFLALGTAARAQDPPPPTPTPQEMIEVARETYRPPGLGSDCPVGRPGEIVVCASNPDEFRVDSSTDEAIAAGEPVDDGIPRAPNVFGIPPCESYMMCTKFGSVPPYPPLIDLEALPEPLTREEAANVFHAEDRPNPAAASPAAVP